jgi:hypothetical protein
MASTSWYLSKNTHMKCPCVNVRGLKGVFNAHYFNPCLTHELAGQEQFEAGVNLGVVRLPQVHDTANQGFTSPARENGVVAYVDQGASRWATGHVSDLAKLYVRALDPSETGARCDYTCDWAPAGRQIRRG